MGVCFVQSPAFVGVFVFSCMALCLLHVPELALAQDSGITRHYKFDVCVVLYMACAEHLLI